MFSKHRSDDEIEDQAEFAKRTLARLVQHLENVPGSGELMRAAQECVARNMIGELASRSRRWRTRFYVASALLIVALVTLAYELGFLNALFK